MQATTWMIMGAMVGTAFKGIFARLAYAEGTSVMGVLGMRMVMALPLFWLVAWWAARGERASPAGERAPRPQWWWAEHGRAVAVGVVILGAMYADFATIERIGAGPSRVVLFTFPGLVLLIEAIMARRWPLKRHVLGFAVSWVGLAGVAMPDVVVSLCWGGRQGGVEPTPQRLWAALDLDLLSGVGFGLLGAVCYASFTLLSQRATRRLGSTRFVALSNTGATLSLGLAAVFLVEPEAVSITRGGALWTAVMAIFSTVLPIALMFEAIRRVGASRVSLMMMAGPLVTVSAAWLLLGESLTGVQLVGAALVIAMGPVLQRSGSAATPQARPTPEPAESSEPR